MPACDVRPLHIAAAAALITNTSGQTLLVSNPYRDGLVLPGGLIEQDESPATAAEREALEEVGLDVTVIRLLVVQHKPVYGIKPSSLQFVFDCDPVDDDVLLRLQADEISGTYWLDEEMAVSRHTARGQARLGQAFVARAQGSTVYMDEGRKLES